MYLVLKLIHVFAVIMFVGNITVGILWKALADRTRDARIIAHTMAGIIEADRWFTVPAVILLLIAGFGTAAIGHMPVLGTGWILWALIMFVIAGIAFGPISRTQRSLLSVAREGVAAGALDWDEYERLSARWNVAGIIALVTPLVAVALMVLKPSLRAFHR
ncbi:MAG: DUF2269 family protein [Candidatus Eremiobacter antarcticus]|nr:DUF2269 domain-containing protein [Candidatus Eremiobacteraeota bacterium]MBC5809150.1 DUF2269 domain-containing protein [Candidatus Eremiobacteraeota bacterium]PZR68248.1 MAG: hypothetical protein DLM63_04325 [Solirubrobacterales bacterium]